MHRIESFSNGGFPLTTDRLSQMQQCWQLIAELAKGWGDNVVIHGCQGWGGSGTIGSGLIVFNGELLPFEASSGHLVDVFTTTESVTYADGQQHPFFTHRVAKATATATSTSKKQSDFTRANPLASLATQSLLTQKENALQQRLNALEATLLGAQGNINDLSALIVPRGMIAMWSGAINQIPTGWALCNGQNGTPDLRDRFIVGAGNEYYVGSKGGYKEVKLTVSQLPEHSHYLPVTIDHWGRSFKGENGEPKTVCAGSYSTTLNTGSSHAHENRPPYYALAFIMKL